MSDPRILHLNAADAKTAVDLVARKLTAKGAK